MTKRATRKQRARPEIVSAPEIRHARGEMVLDRRVITDERGRVQGVSEGDRRSYLLTYYRRKQIDAPQWQAGDRFCADYEHAQAGVPSALDPARVEAVGGGALGRSLQSLSLDPIAGLLVRRAVLAIGWPLAEIVIWVGIEGRHCAEWATARGKAKLDGIACLRLALSALAKHYSRSAPGERHYG